MPNPFDIAESELTGAKAANPFDVAETELSSPAGQASKLTSPYYSLKRGVVSALGIPDVMQAAGTAGISKPTVAQSRRAFVSAMSDPQYQEQLIQSSGDRDKLLRVESMRGPEAKLEAMKLPARVLERANVEEVAKTQGRLAEYPTSPAQERLAKAGTSGEKWGAWLKDPVELTASIVLESLPPSMAGAVVGSVGGPGGVAAGVGASSGAMTFASEFLNAAASDNVDLKDPQSLQEFLDDEARFRPAFSKAMTKAVIVGGVDAATAGTAGRWIEPALKQGLKQRAVATGKEVLLQAAGGAGGEAAAEVATGQKLDPFDIAMEALAEVATTPGEVLSNLRHKSAATEAPPPAAEQPKIAESQRATEPPVTPPQIPESNPFDVAEAGANPFDIAEGRADPIEELVNTLGQNVTPVREVRVDDETGKPIEPVKQYTVGEALKDLPSVIQDLRAAIAGNQLSKPSSPSEAKPTAASIADTGLVNAVPTASTKTTPAASAPPAAGGSVVELLKQEGLSDATAQRLAAGEITADQAVDETLPTIVQPGPNQGHDEAYTEARDQGLERLQKIIAKPTAKPSRFADVPAATQEPDDTALDYGAGAGGSVVPAVERWQPTPGKQVIVQLTGRGKGRLAKVIQVQPDGSAMVKLDGEKVYRTVNANQMRPTGQEAARRAKAEEVAQLPPAAQGDANEFAALVEEFATHPDLGWVEPEAYGEADVKGQGIEFGRLRQAAREKAARVVGIADYQDNSVADRARALPALEEFLQRKFPGDNTVANRRAVRKFKADEATPLPPAPALDRHTADQRRVERIGRQNPGEPLLQGLRVAGTKAGPDGVAGAAVQRPGRHPELVRAGETKEGRELKALIERLFGVHLIPVESADGSPSRFHGYKDRRSNAILYDPHTSKPMLAIIGHELLHHIQLTHPELYAEFKAAVEPLLQDLPGFRERLEARDQSGLSDEGALAELLGDFTGDSLTTPKVLGQLAAREPALFKKFARIALRWLDQLRAKVKGLTGYDSSRYFTDLEQARHLLANTLKQVVLAEQRARFGEREAGAVEEPFSKREEPGFNFEAAETVAEQKARQQREAWAKAEADKLAARQAFVARGGDRLTGQDLDTTREMFGGEVKVDKAGQGSLFSKREGQLNDLDAEKARPEIRRQLDTISHEAYGAAYDDLPDRFQYLVRLEAQDENQAVPGREQSPAAAGREQPLDRGVTAIPRPPEPTPPPARRASAGLTPSAQRVLALDELRKQIRYLEHSLRNVSHPRSTTTVSRLGKMTTLERPAVPQPELTARLQSELDSARADYDEIYQVQLAHMERLRNNPQWLARQRILEQSGKRFPGAEQAALERESEQANPRPGSLPKWLAAADLAARLTRRRDGFFSKQEAKPWYYDNIARALESWQDKGTPEQLRAHLAKFKGAKDQAEWIGLDDFLKDKTSVTKQQVQDFVAANKVDVQEVEHKSVTRKPLSYDERLEELERLAQEKYGKAYGDLTPGGQFTIQQEIEGVGMDATKFSQYQLPGGENYRELLLTLPEKKSAIPDADIEEQAKVDGGPYWDTFTEQERENARNEVRGRFERNRPGSFRSTHFDEPNILAHVRFNDRTDARGRKILFLEEVQSDWHQKGRKEGYGEPEGERNYQAAHKELLDEARRRSGIHFAEDTNPAILGGHVAVSTWEAFRRAEQGRSNESVGLGKVPNAPFKGAGWKKLALRRMLAYAAENSYDGIGWTTGEQQAARYDLSNQVEHISWGILKDGGKHVEIPIRSTDQLFAFNIDQSGKVVSVGLSGRGGEFIGKPLSEVIGKDAADKVMATPNGKLEGDGLKVGGEGMKGAYDRELPNLANAIAKPFGQRVERTEIATSRINAWGVEKYEGGVWKDIPGDYLSEADAVNAGEASGSKYRIVENPTTYDASIHFLATPDAMRQRVQDEGLPLFSRTEGEPGSVAELQGRITQAEQALRAAIAQVAVRPAGMNKAQAQDIKNRAAAALRNLRHDLLTSPDYAEEMIRQEREQYRQIKALLEPVGIPVTPDSLEGREERIRAALSPVEVQRLLDLYGQWEQTRNEISLMSKRLVGETVARLYPPRRAGGPAVLDVPSEWLTAQDAEDVTSARDRFREAVAELPATGKAIYHEATRFASQMAAKARTIENRDIVNATKDAADNKGQLLGRQAANVLLHELNRAFGVPLDTHNLLRENALTFAVEAQNLESLGLMRDTIETSQHARSRWAKTAIDAINYAEKHWARFEQVVPLYERVSTAQVGHENAAGIKTLTRKGGYVFHLQDVLENWQHLDVTGGAGGIATPFKNVRDYATYADSIAAGLSPKSLNALDLMQRRVALGQKLINYRAWVGQLRGLVDPATELPLAADVVVRVRADGTETHTAPIGYSLMKFAGQTYAIHKGYVGLFKALTSDSNLRMTAGWHTLMRAATTAKHMMLLFDSFHLGRLAYWNSITRGAGPGAGAILPGNPFSHQRGYNLLESTPADIQKRGQEGEFTPEQVAQLLENKATLGKLLDAGLNVGSVGDNIYNDWVRKLPLAGQFNRWLFEKYQRGAMTEVALIEFQRQRQMHQELTDAQVARMTAKAVNIRFGNLNSQAWVKSRFAQDLLRIVFLAPQWNESLIRSEIEAVKDAGKLAAGLPQGKLRVGTLGRAVATAFIGQFIANQLINYFFRGQPTWDNDEEGFESKISAWVPDFVGNSAGYFLNPMTLPTEMTHLILKGHARTGRWDESVVEAIRSRFSSFGRFAAIFYQGKNSMGERSTGLGSRLALAAEESAPLPIGAQAPSRMVASAITGESKERYPGQFQRQLMQSVGIKPDTAPSPERRISALAREFNREAGKESTLERMHSPYADLDNYLRTGNQSAARAELKTILETRTPEQVGLRYEQRTIGRFTGSTAREKAFKASLNAEQRKQYELAIAERKRIRGEVEKLLRAVR